MASEVTTMTRKRRKFSKEFKLETVKLVKEGPRSIVQRDVFPRVIDYRLDQGRLAALPRTHDEDHGGVRQRYLHPGCGKTRKHDA